MTTADGLASQIGPMGRRVVMTGIAEHPMEAVDHRSTLEPMQPPAPDALGPRDVVIAVRSAHVNWVVLLMTSGLYQHLPKPPYCPGPGSRGVSKGPFSCIAE